MTKTVSGNKADLLEYFYEHLSEGEWLEGVDIYQAGKVTNIQNYQSLISCSVQGHDRKQSEVRLKVHPSGKVIQWIECTCKKNRSYGHYCEHIAAMMIHVDREKPEFFGRLDIRMPLKPPTTARKLRTRPNLTQTVEGGLKGRSGRHNQQKSASRSLLDHLKGSIQQVSLISHGPCIRVRIEIRPGTTINYDLDIDSSASFLSNHKSRNLCSKEVRALKIYQSRACPGTRIYQTEQEKIVAERVIGIGISSEATLKGLRIAHSVEKCSFSPNQKTPAKDSLYGFIGMKSASRYCGKEFVFVPGKGYWPLDMSLVQARWHELPLSKSFREDDAARLIDDNFKAYRETGAVWTDLQLKQPKIEELPQLSEIRIHGEQDGWFQLDPRYGKGASGISMGRLMMQAQKKKRKYIRHGDSWLKIPDFITQNNWMLDDNEQYLQVDALGLMRLKASIGDFDQFVGSSQILDRIRSKIEYNPNLQQPDIANTRLRLRQYQQEGLRWFWWLYKNQIHGLLADDMGLGKTHQAMALMSAIQQDEQSLSKAEIRQPVFLVICPTTVLEHWADKVHEFAPNLKPLLYHGPRRMSSLGKMGAAYQLMITSYGVLLRDIKKLSEISWHAVILDEAHFVKNNNTATYQAACRLNSRIRLCLTGTPMENHLGELKNLFDFLVPGYLGSDEYFRKNFILPIQNKDVETELALQKLIHPLKLRRTKKQVLQDLPAKVEDIRHCSLSQEQVRLYRSIIQMRAKPLLNQISDDSSPVPYLHVFAILQLLKQVCNHPALLKDSGAYQEHASGKFELLKEIIEESLNSGNKIVIFSQYVKMIEIIGAYCKDQGIGHVLMTGQTRNRGRTIDRFQNDQDIKIFAGSLMAGGIGIDLTAASVVVHYDRWWNASKEDQATDRVHRIGQKKFVQVMKLVTRGTLEEKIDRMISKKQSIFNKFIENDEEIFKSLSRHDLMELLQ